MQKSDKIYIQTPIYYMHWEGFRWRLESYVRHLLLTNYRWNRNMERRMVIFVVEHRYTFEVGGPDKTFKQIANVPESYILAENLEYASGNKLPL